MEANKKIGVRHLNLYYGKTQALKDINIDVYDKEVLALIGPSGCGKSTFLRSLNRMNDLIEGCRVEGEIVFDDENINSKKVDVNLLRKRIGMVFQRPNPFPTSIYDNIAFAPRLFGVIARALSASPEVLLMDEPTSALDPISTAKIEELMGTLKNEMSIVIVTHNMQQATRVADKTAFFLLGEMVEYAPTKALFSTPKDKRTLNYITGRFG